MNLEDLTILYAEDESGIRDTVTDVLELYVDRVITATNGEEALEVYKTYNPSILLLDICMPLKDGLELLKEIRKRDLKTPVIIMTAHTEQNYLMDAVELYITKYLVKPFDKDTLLDALNESLRVINKDFSQKQSLGKNIIFNREKPSIIKDSEEVHLNKKEVQLLNLFLKNINKTMTYENIEYHIWQDPISKETLKSLIKDLRKKTSKDLIKNISGIGYRIEIAE